MMLMAGLGVAAGEKFFHPRASIVDCVGYQLEYKAMVHPNQISTILGEEVSGREDGAQMRRFYQRYGSFVPSILTI